MNNSNISIDEINRLEREVYGVVAKELEEDDIPYEVQVRIHDNVRTTGVQGDKRTYCPLIEITLLEKGKIIWDKEFASKISTKIINNVRDTNRVVVTIPTYDKEK